jgi:hypothetical protein
MMAQNFIVNAVVLVVVGLLISGISAKPTFPATQVSQSHLSFCFHKLLFLLSAQSR